MDATIDTHNCQWRKKAEELIQTLDELQKRIEQLERMLFGKRSEKMPSVKKELKTALEPVKIQATRAERRAARKDLPEVRYKHHVAEKDKQCPKCGSCELKELGEGKISTIIEYVPAHLERQVHVQETLACSCGEYIVVAQGPQRPVEGGQLRFLNQSTSICSLQCLAIV